MENEGHCDFVKLRNMLIRTHMEDMKERTNDVLYEDYRANKLAQLSPNGEPIASPIGSIQ